VSERAPSYTVHDGFRMPMGFPVEGFDSGQRYRARPGDIFVSSYPKCGTTWVQYILWLILHRGEPLPLGRRIDEVFPHLEEVGQAPILALPEPRLIKTHFPFERTPWNRAAKYVYVARNPLDCVVSFYHHTRGFALHYDFADGTFDTYFECFIRGEVDFGDYFDNLLSWVAQRGEPNVLFLTYEDMTAAPRDAVRAIGDFLGGEHARAAREPEVLARIVGHSSFDSMHVDQSRWSSARPADMPAFVRKGVVGDWRNHCSAEQARRLADKFHARTRGTPAAHFWPDIMAEALTARERR
jgi:hypothetical protein